MSSYKDLNKHVITKNLCCYCGTCVGVCPKNVLVAENETITVATPEACIECSLCFKSCPGHGFDYPLATHDIFQKEYKNNSALGIYCKILKGYSTDNYISSRASSGGLLTAVILYLLQEKLIDGVIGIAIEGTNGYKPAILRSKAEIIDAMQSKYTLIPVNEAIKYIAKAKGKYVAVGLPCQIQGLRKAVSASPLLKDKIYCYLGLFCGFNMSHDATDYLVQKSKFKKDEIQSLEYRGRFKGKTGFRITTINGEKFFIEKHGYTILNILYSPVRCWKCYDFTNEFSDISFGDAWEMQQEGEGGYSRIITRTDLGESIINAMQTSENQLVSMQNSSIDDIHLTQKQIISYKKNGIWIRRKILGNFPDYNIIGDQIPFIKKIKAAFFCFALILGKTKLVRFCFKIMPLNLFKNTSILLRIVSKKL